jgi:N-acyl-D-amino-acid deacylase
VTTEICGNCGLSPFPLFGGLRERFVREARDEFGWGTERLNWAGAAEYFDRLKEVGCAINRGFLVGHNSLRAAIRGYGDGAVSEGARAAMIRELEAALAAGCLGLSTGLVYPPGCYAATEELIELARVCARHGALYATHMRSESDRLEQAVLETLRVAREGGVPVQISHLKTAHPQNWRKIDFLEETLLAARREGLNVHADRYPYTASSTGLDAALPRWAYAGGTAEEMKRLADPQTCARMEGEVQAQHPEQDYWARVKVAAAAEPELQQEIAGRSLADLAGRWRVSPFEALRSILIRDRCRTTAIFFIMSEENLEKILSWDFVMIGSDATARNVAGPTRLPYPHPRTFGAFPRVLSRYVREKKLLALEEAVRRMTSLPAHTFRLRGRGRMAPGAHADLVVLDAARVQDEATFDEPNRFPTGIEQVYVNGTQVVESGKVLAARPGEILRPTD